MLNEQQLIGKRVYLSEPELVSDCGEPFRVPVLVETITGLENAAGFVINGRFLVGINWVQRLLNNLDNQSNRQVL